MYTPMIFFLSLLFVILALAMCGKKRAPKLPPGPTNLPVIGNLHRLGTHLHRSLFELSQRHGPLMFLKLGTIPTVVASSAEWAEEFLKIHDLECCTRPYTTSLAKLSYGRADIATASYGSVWRQLRKICIVEFFSTKKVLMFKSIREEEIALMIDNIISQPAVNLSAMLLSVSNDITCRAALGRRYYDGENGEASRLHEILEETEELLGGFFFADYLPAFGWLDILTGMRERLWKNFSDLDSLFERVIDEHIDPMRGGEDGGEDTLDALLRIQKEAAWLTRENIKAVLLDILVGGSDTSSTTMEWAMAELMRNPRAMKKAQEEVRELIGTKGKVEESDLPQLRYLKSIVKEAMRLHPPAPTLLHRETMKDVKIKDFDIPAGTRVIVNAFAIGREEGSWEKPEEFKPERFVDNYNFDPRGGHDFQMVYLEISIFACDFYCVSEDSKARRKRGWPLSFEAHSRRHCPATENFQIPKIFQSILRERIENFPNLEFFRQQGQLDQIGNNLGINSLNSMLNWIENPSLGLVPRLSPRRDDHSPFDA